MENNTIPTELTASLLMGMASSIIRHLAKTQTEQIEYSFDFDEETPVVITPEMMSDLLEFNAIKLLKEK